MRSKRCAGNRGKVMLTSDFKEFAELLNSNGVEYLVVGGYRDLADLEALEGPLPTEAGLDNGSGKR